MEYSIEAVNLCKRYGNSQVVRDVTFRIGSGKLVGFLGPNGAGKTTTIRILLGLLKANSGTTQIFGCDTRAEGKTLRRQIGYLPGDVHLYPNMSGLATLRFLANARRVNCKSEISRLGQRFDLDLKKTVRKYSTGMKQKLGLIQALMHRPKLLILDEPTSGLDPLVKKVVFEELREVVSEGRTILFSSHSLDEVEELCDEVIILRSGKIVEQQKIETLRKRALRRIEIVFRDHVPDVFPEELQQIQRSDKKVTGNWTGTVQRLISQLSVAEVEDLIVERPDLNDLFMTYYSDSGLETRDEISHDASEGKA